MTSSIYPAEFIFPGHPDKLCDAIADSLVQAAQQRESRALVGVEVAAHRDHIYITGRIACENAEDIDIKSIVRDVYQSAGYDKEWYPEPKKVKVTSNLCLGPLEDGEAEYRELADDQAICIGYANDLEATNYLPMEHWLVTRFAKRLYALRLDLPDLQLGPDGKVLISVRETAADDGTTWQLESFSCSLQQKVGSDEIALHRAVRLAIEEELLAAAKNLPALSPELPKSLTVNGAGNFEVGGPEGDNGLSGKKLVCDAYGPRVPIGGGAWSGKDFFKADRAGGLHARKLAKMIVQLGITTEAQVVLGWFPGDRAARILRIEAAGGRLLDPQRFEQMFDLSLLKSGTTYQVTDLVQLARWGHFGEVDYPWANAVGI